MKYEQAEWLGRWQNFESYLTSTEPAMLRAWAEAEHAAKAMPMFKGGVKSFWAAACTTTTQENPTPLGGWNITPEGENLAIEWFAADGSTLGKAVYHLDSVLPKGLEGKPNALFVAADAAPDWPLRCLLAMEPMPARDAYKAGGLLSHLHFQYASKPELLFDADGSLCNPMWYATMCDASGDLLARCNIVRAMHHLPVWTELPQE